MARLETGFSPEFPKSFSIKPRFLLPPRKISPVSEASKEMYELMTRLDPPEVVLRASQPSETARQRLTVVRLEVARPLRSVTLLVGDDKLEMRVRLADRERERARRRLLSLVRGGKEAFRLVVWGLTRRV